MFLNSAFVARTRVLGVDHPDTLTSNALGEITYTRGDLDGAFALFSHWWNRTRVLRRIIPIRARQDESRSDCLVARRLSVRVNCSPAHAA